MNVKEIIMNPDYNMLESDIGCALESAVDWLTVTTASKEVGGEWVNKYVEYRDSLPGDKPELLQKPWKTLGFEGVGVPGIRIGQRAGMGFIAVLSGNVSQRLWKFFIPGARRITRVDIAVTVRFGLALPGLASQYYDYAIIQLNEESNRKYALVQNNSGGQTLYVGSRSSQQFGRIYDKGIEAKIAPAGFCWRYEVEYKKPLADEIAKALSRMEERDGIAVINTVHRWFQERLVSPLFREDGAALRTSVETRVETDDRKINWLRSQVAPTVFYLISRGRGADVLYALGLIEKSEHSKLVSQSSNS